MKKFYREDRYIVLKRSDIKKYLTPEESVKLLMLRSTIFNGRRDEGKKVLEAVVIEHDWPEFENVWNMLEERVTKENAQ